MNHNKNIRDLIWPKATKRFVSQRDLGQVSAQGRTLDHEEVGAFSENPLQ